MKANLAESNGFLGMMDSTVFVERPDVYVGMHDNCLVFANTGTPFSPAGIEAICTEHRSSKRIDDKSHYTGDADGEKHLASIRARHIREYRENPARLYEDYGSESESRKDYGGRVLLELLQNADDAHSELKIGHKGLGFKSVLNISDNPRIYSGHVAIEFGTELANAALIDAGIEGSSIDHAPVLRLPHHAEINNENELIRKIVGQFDTTVVLPISLDDTQEKLFFEHWEETASDPSLLLFLHTLGSVHWANGQDQARWDIQRSDSVQTVSLTTAEATETQSWLIRKVESCALAVKLADGGIDTTVSYPFLRSYFPTTEPNPFPAVLAHLELDLKQDRDRFRWELDPARTQQVLEDYTGAFNQIVEYCDNAGTVLDLLHIDTNFAHAEELAQAVYASVQQMVVPGLAGVLWSEVRLAPVSPDRVRSAALQTWEQFKQLIKNAERDVLSYLKILPIGLDSVDREEVLKNLSRSGHITIMEISEKEVFRSTEGKWINVSSLPVFEVNESTRLPDTQSNCVSYQTVEFDYENKLGDVNPQRMGQLTALIRSIGIFEYSPVLVIEKAILPVLRQGDQDEKLVGLLFDLLKNRFGPNSDAPFSWRNRVQAELATLLEVRDQEGNLRSPAQMYFGQAWGADELIDLVYGQSREHGLLHLPRDNWADTDRIKWAKFYQWLGVSYFPKVLPIINSKETPKTKEGALFVNGGVARIESPPAGWDQYCNEIAGQFFYYDPSSYKSRMRTNWRIDIAEEKLGLPGVLDLILKGWETEYSSYMQSRCYSSTNKSQDNDNHAQNVDAYWLWMLRKLTWVSVNASSRYALSELFLPGEVSEALDGWVVTIDSEGFEEAAEKLGIRKDWSDIGVSDWDRWFARSLELNCDSDDGKESRRAVEQLYRYFLNRSEGQLQTGELWSLERDVDGSESWTRANPRSSTYFVDWPQHEKLRMSGLYRFPVSLGGYAKRAEEKLGISPLSSHLLVTVESPERNVSLERAIDQLLLDRKHYLIAYLMTFSKREVEDLSSDFERLNINAFHNLAASYSLDEEVLALSILTDYIYSPTEKTLAIDVERSQGDDGKLSIPGYEAVAWGVIYVLRLSQRHHSNIKDIISYPKENLYDKLLDLGVTLADIEYWEGQRATVAPSEIDGESAALKDPDTETENPEVGEPPESVDGGAKTPEDEGSANTPPSSPSEGDGGAPPNDKPPAKPGGKGIAGRGVLGKKKGGAKKPRLGANGQGSGAGPGFINHDHWKQAEKHVRDYLNNELTSEGWTVSAAPVRDEKLAETDILLSHPDHAEIHVEVKHLSSNVLFWSELEFGKAQEHSGRYFMVLLTGSASADSVFDVYWSFDPESDLTTAAIRESWRWYKDRTAVGLPLSDWIVSEDRPQAEADGYAFRIEIESFNSHELVPGIDAILPRLPRQSKDR